MFLIGFHLPPAMEERPFQVDKKIIKYQSKSDFLLHYKSE
jgi:hypothetical protein